MKTFGKTANIATNFYMNIPNDDRPASMESEVRMTYDEQNFYFAITCYDGQDGYVVQSLRRDWDWPLNENFSIYLDPYNDFLLMVYLWQLHLMEYKEKVQ